MDPLGQGSWDGALMTFQSSTGRLHSELGASTPGPSCASPASLNSAKPWTLNPINPKPLALNPKP